MGGRSGSRHFKGWIGGALRHTRAASLKPVLLVSISKLAMYSSHAWNHFKCMQLGTCHPFPIQVTKGPFDGCQKSFKGVECGHFSQGCAGIIGSPDLSHPSAHE